MRAIRAAEKRARRKIDFLIRYSKQCEPGVLVSTWWRHRKSGILYLRAFGEWTWRLAMQKVGMIEAHLVRRLEDWLRTAPFQDVRWVHRVRLPRKRDRRSQKAARAVRLRLDLPESWEAEDDLVLETVRSPGGLLTNLVK